MTPFCDAAPLLACLGAFAQYGPTSFAQFYTPYASALGSTSENSPNIGNYLDCISGTSFSAPFFPALCIIQNISLTLMDGQKVEPTFVSTCMNEK